MQIVRRGARLARMQLVDRPDKLAAGFRKTLTAWRRSTKFHTYREAGQFGRTLESWLDQVARELLPKDPAAALAQAQGLALVLALTLFALGNDLTCR